MLPDADSLPSSHQLDQNIVLAVAAREVETASAQLVVREDD